jgi:glucose/mannose transport system permease protein
MWNLLVLTVVFVAGTMVFGLLWALLLEKGVTGEGFFRSIFLFPMAVSFVAAGVIWRWLLSMVPATNTTVSTSRFHMAC